MPHVAAGRLPLGDAAGGGTPADRPSCSAGRCRRRRSCCPRCTWLHPALRLHPDGRLPLRCRGPLTARQVVRVAEGLPPVDALRAVMDRVATDNFVLLSGDVVAEASLRVQLLTHCVREAAMTALFGRRKVLATQETKPGRPPKNVDYVGGCLPAAGCRLPPAARAAHSAFVGRAASELQSADSAGGHSRCWFQRGWHVSAVAVATCSNWGLSLTTSCGRQVLERSRRTGRNTSRLSAWAAARVLLGSRPKTWAPRGRLFHRRHDPPAARATAASRRTALGCMRCQPGHQNAPSAPTPAWQALRMATGWRYMCTPLRRSRTCCCRRPSCGASPTSRSAPTWWTCRQGMPIVPRSPRARPSCPGRAEPTCRLCQPQPSAC